MVHGCRFASAHSAQPGILVPVRKIRRKAEEWIASDCVSYYHFDSIGSIILKPGIPLYLRLENNYIAEETCIIWFRHVPHGKVAKAGGCIIRAPSAGVWDGLCARLQDAIQQKVDAGLIQTFTKQMGPQMPFPQDSTRSDILACTMRYLLRGYFMECGMSARLLETKNSKVDSRSTHSTLSSSSWAPFQRKRSECAPKCTQVVSRGSQSEPSCPWRSVLSMGHELESCKDRRSQILREY